MGMQETMQRAEHVAGDMDPDFPLRAGWEEPGPDDQIGHSLSTATPVWPGRACEPAAGWIGDAREVFVQGSDALPLRYRRRHVLRYPTVLAAEDAFDAATRDVRGHPVIEDTEAGLRWYIAATTTHSKAGEELSVLRWTREGAGATGGSSAFRVVRRGRALLISSDVGIAIGHQAAIDLAEADRRGLAPAVLALGDLGAGLIAGAL